MEDGKVEGTRDGGTSIRFRTRGNPANLANLFVSRTSLHSSCWQSSNFRSLYSSTAQRLHKKFHNGKLQEIPRKPSNYATLKLHQVSDILSWVKNNTSSLATSQQSRDFQLLLFEQMIRLFPRTRRRIWVMTQFSIESI
jgi:hypothetical protein